MTKKPKKEHNDEESNMEQDSNGVDEEVNVEDENNSPADTSSTETTDLQQELEQAQEKAQKHYDMYVRAHAETENTRRRAKIDIENAHKYSVERFAKELLTVLDSLESGLEHANNSTEDAKAIFEGMQLTHKMLISVLDKYGIKEIDPLGHPFDPKLHEALTAQPSEDAEPNTVLLVVRKGFTFNERILRAAQVIVSK